MKNKRPLQDRRHPGRLRSHALSGGLILEGSRSGITGGDRPSGFAASSSDMGVRVSRAAELRADLWRRPHQFDQGPPVRKNVLRSPDVVSQGLRSAFARRRRPVPGRRGSPEASAGAAHRLRRAQPEASHFERHARDDLPPAVEEGPRQSTPPWSPRGILLGREVRQADSRPDRIPKRPGTMRNVPYSREVCSVHPALSA